MSPDEWNRLTCWMSVASRSNYYEVLGVLELADRNEIKRAFHAFALAFHPDVHVDQPAEVRDCVDRIFRLGVEAYRTLSDFELRSRYDLALAEGKLRLDSPSASQNEMQPGAPRSLESLCRTPAASLCARRADACINTGDFATARRHLMEALAQDDYANNELEERIDALDFAVYAGGR